MVEPAHIMDIIGLNPIDIAIGVISFIIGRFTFSKDKNRSIGLFLQVSLLMIRMAKHYIDTHPEAKKKLSRHYQLTVDELHKKHESHHTQALG